MITLIMLINQLRNSGPNRVMLDIAQNIDRANIKPVVISLMPDDNIRPIDESFKNIGVDIYRFKFNFFELELMTNKVARIIETFIIKKFNNPVVQAHGYHPTLLTARMKLPITTTIHCISKEDFISSKGYMLGNYMVHRFARNLKKHKYPVAISSYMTDFYKDVCGSRIKLIYNGVSYVPENINVKDIRTLLNISDDKKLIVVTGRLHAGKNNLFLISQLKKVNLNNFVCIFLGLGPQEKELKDAIDSDKRFRLEGYKSNVKDYLYAADLYISASISEGLPLAVLEAVCMGLPTLLSDIPPHNEIANKINYPGVKTFNLGSDELSALLPSFIAKDWNKSIISHNALKIFSSKTMGQAYSELIKTIFSGNKQ